MIKFFIPLVLFISSSPLRAQVKFAPESIKDDPSNYVIDSFRVKYKAQDFSHALYNALIYYPQLKGVHLVVVNKKMDMLMKVRPTILSSFRRPFKRKYKIYVNNSKLNGAPHPGEFTFNAQIGIFGHELTHVCDYLHMRFGKLVKTASRYKQNVFKKEMEQRTDRNTLKNGLGWQLYDYATQWNKLGETYKAYVEKKKLFYLGPEEMLSLMLLIGYN
jgi:hypothetical protein